MSAIAVEEINFTMRIKYMIKIFNSRLMFLSLSLIASSALALVQPLESTSQLAPNEQMTKAAIIITGVIERYHYRKIPLDDALSEKVLERYLAALDPNRNFFFLSDINQFDSYKHSLDDNLRIGDMQAAFAIFNVYRERVKERITYALTWLNKKLDFAVNENYPFNREKEPWPDTQITMDDLWRKRVKNDFLGLRLADKKDQEINEILRKRYTTIERRVRQFDAEEVFQTFMNAYTLSIEPHTSYMSPSNSENFDISMRLSLEGVGAVLRSDNEFTVIQKIVNGGPAELSKQIQVGDKIIGVAQGLDGRMEDVVGWRLQDVVDRIRGPKGSVVRLEVIPKSIKGIPKHRVVSLVRNTIKLEDQAAKKFIVQGLADMDKIKIGVINIPAFYRDFRGEYEGNENFRSTTRDVRQLLKELKAENVNGVVIDLRQNGGGSLAEATELTGLFIGRGPVVQVRDSFRKIEVEMTKGSPLAYDGPLAVLVDNNSASASEIFAGAIQDYKRGLIIGESTFGKGTVQTLVDLNRIAPGTGYDMGKLRLTMAQFFRVNGASTQHRGVEPDIAFPASKYAKDQGERSFDNALPWAKIAPAQYTSRARWPIAYAKLRALSEQRVKSDAGFLMLEHQRLWLKTLDENKAVSLNEKLRRAESGKQEQRLKAERNLYLKSKGVTVKDSSATNNDNVDSEMDSEMDEQERKALDQIQLNEAARILTDFLHTQPNGPTKSAMRN